MTPDRWRRAQEIFVAATEREPGTRAAFLDEACRGDPELRSEVESLLSSFDAAPADFLESPAIDGSSLPQPKPAMASAVGKGTRLGPYEILSLLGTGGMGEVYRARDERLGREVAIKVLSAELSLDSSRVKRFEREARSASALNHPNIVTVYDFGSSGGLSYIAMEKVDGETLRKLIAGGPISIKKLLPIARQVADGLARAHEAGIVHRDLKPENVMVTRDGLIKILDFGLAKLTSTESRSGERSKPSPDSETTPGVIFGTVGFMSPEQASGGSVDYRSDQFSFGSILYEMATGKPAFQKKTPVDTMAAILNEQPESLAAPNLAIPAPLRWIMERCLAKDPEERYASTKDLARDLATVQGHLTEASSPSRGQYGISRIVRRNVILASAVIVLAVAGALLVRRSPSAEGPRVKRVVVLPFENLGPPEDDYFADGIADDIRGKLTSLPGFQVIARGSSTPLKRTTKTPKQVAEDLGVAYILTATVRWDKSDGHNRVHVSPELMEVSGSGAPTSKWQQPFDAALTDVFQVQSDIASRVAQALGVVLEAGQEKRLSEKPTLSLTAYDSFLRGEEVSKGLSATEPGTLRRALVFYEQAVTLDPGFADAWAQVSRANSALYSNSTPVPALAKRARLAAERAVALAPERPEGYLALGTYHRLVTRDFASALEQFAQGRRHAPGNADLLRGTALAEAALGRWDVGVGHFQMAERLDPQSVHDHRAVGEALLRLRRYAEAREAYNQGLAIAPTNLTLIEHKVMTYLGEGNLVDARAVLRSTAGEIEPAALVAEIANYWDLVWVLDEPQRDLLRHLTPNAFEDDRGTWGLCLAQDYALSSDSAKVREYAEEARKAFEEQVGAAPQDAGRRVALGLSLAYLGRKDDAIREGEYGVGLVAATKDAIYGPYIQHQLARIYMLVGEPEKALDQLELLLRIPCYLSPAWLKIDPNFDPLRKNPRFQKLVTGGK